MNHYDGTGLDQTVATEDIPLAQGLWLWRMPWMAMTSDRPYRPAMPRENAFQEIKKSAHPVRPADCQVC